MHPLRRLLRTIGGGADVVRGFLRGSDEVDGIRVYGHQEFRAAVREALLLIRDNKLPAWRTLTSHVGSIFAGRRTFVIVTAHPAFMFIDGPHSRQEPEFLAGTLAYLACSCELHRAYGAEFPGRRVPRDVYAGRAAEVRCESAHAECLQALGKSADTRSPGVPT